MKSWERFCCNGCVTVMMAVFFNDVLLSDWLQRRFCCDSALVSGLFSCEREDMEQSTGHWLWKGRECGSRRVLAPCCVFPATSVPVFKALILPVLTPPAHLPLSKRFLWHVQCVFSLKQKWKYVNIAIMLLFSPVPFLRPRLFRWYCGVVWRNECMLNCSLLSGL